MIVASWADNPACEMALAYILQSAKKIRADKGQKERFLIDEEEDHHEGTSRAWRRPSWARNADVLSVWQARGRNRQNRQSLAWTKLLLLQRQMEQGRAEWELTMFRSRGAYLTSPEGHRILARSSR